MNKEKQITDLIHNHTKAVKILSINFRKSNKNISSVFVSKKKDRKIDVTLIENVELYVDT